MDKTLSKEQYLKAVLQGIKNCRNLDIVVKFLPSIDRGRTMEDAEESMNLVFSLIDTDAYARKTIVGIDLSGNPFVCTLQMCTA